MSEEGSGRLDPAHLLVFQVSAIVSATAEALVQSGVTSDHVLTVEAGLYRILADNCDDKAKMMSAFAKDAADRAG